MADRLLVRRRSIGVLFLLLLVVSLAVSDAYPRQEPAQARHEIVLSAHRYEFSPARIDVAAGDIVKITLIAEDIPHSFTLDAYRISKRAKPGEPVTFEFRADRAGTFPFYCALTIEDGCKAMKGELVVAARQH